VVLLGAKCESYMRFSSKVLLFLLLLVSVAPLVTPTTHSTSTTTQATENQTSVLRDAAIALFSIFVSALIALMLDRRKDLQELRKEHLSTIKSEVLVPMLDELSQYDSRTYSNIAYAGVLVPLALKDLPVPVSKLYDTLPNHFPAMSASWNNYRLHIEKWSEKCVALYSSMKQSAEKQLQFEAASELDTKKVWRAIEELLKDVYFSLFDDRALEAIERFRIRGTIRLSLELRAKVNLQKEDFDSFEIKYGDAPLPAIL
jgi:hypothetical protein